MNKENMILLAVVAASVFGLARYLVGRTRGSAPAGNVYGAQEVPLAVENGWKYYTDGTAIGPDGRYYYQGAEVYNPAGMYK